ncbi:MAG: hypothetical protein DME32_13930 [Verrucomicrobia bacterium]|nr:MAG: hypothetical protein DME32_13930 [Verrucomicrobiota bacterium]
MAIAEAECSGECLRIGHSVLSNNRDYGVTGRANGPADERIKDGIGKGPIGQAEANVGNRYLAAIVGRFNPSLTVGGLGQHLRGSEVHEEATLV